MVKNKVAPPFRRVELEIMFGKGISASASLIDAAVKCNIVDKKGAWYTYGEEKLGQGRENAKGTIEQNKDLADEIEAKVRAVFFPRKEPKEPKGAAAAEKMPAAGSPVSGKAQAPAAPAPAANPAPKPVPKPAAEAPQDKPSSRVAKPAADEDGGLF